MMKPIKGEMTMGTMTLGITPLPSHQCAPPCIQITEAKLLPEAAMAAPTNAPTSAWLELDGRPHHQVMRFHTVAASNAQISNCGPASITCVSIRPEAMVLATAVPHSAPIRLVIAASITACPGVSTLVATTVAMELAVSWKPLM